MKKISVFVITIILAMIQQSFAAGIIIDHRHIDISQIPNSWISKVKQDLKIGYSHTSHGSQPVSGMDAFKGSSGDTYYYNKTGYGSHPGVFFNDQWGNAAGANDLGHNGDLSWRNATRTLLNRSNNDRNVVIWSWCGGVQDNTPAGIQTYLDAMNALEQQYPNVTFVYMTGHANTWNDATVKASNTQIRNYCIAHNKILFDFFDIESHNPDGQYFEFVNDDCDYYSSAGGSRQGNWASEWIAANPDSDLKTIATSCGNCAHSEKLNCVLKGRAFWWLMARIAGWNGPGGDSQAPSVPQSLAATATSASAIHLTWSASTDNVGVTGYKIFRDGSEIDTTTALTYSNTGLSASTSYSYTVLAYDAAGNNSDQSASASATTQGGGDSQAPTVPQNLSATATSASAITLTWSASTDNVGVTGYKIFRGGSEIDTTTALTYSNTGLSASTSYSYTVLAYDAAGNNSDQSASASATTQAGADTQAPTVPQNLTATATSTSAITLTWSASTDNVGVTGYKIFRDGSEIDTTSSLTYANTGLTASTSYSYTVLAYDAAGNNSNQSTSASATTQAVADSQAPTVPQNLSATATSASAITLSWSASTDNVGVTGYKIFKDGSEIDTTLSLTYSSTGLTASTSYSYTVLAYDAAGNNSNQSTSASATTQDSSSGGTDYITYSLNNGTVYRVPATENATPTNISETLDAFSARKPDTQLNISPNGEWMVFRTQRFNNNCNNWPCLAVISGDLTTANLVRINNRTIIHPESISAISSDGNLIVYVGDSGPHSRDLFAIRRVANVWQSAVLLTNSSTYSLHDMPALSEDGTKVVFDCDNSNSDVGEAICEVNTDGTDFRVVFTPQLGPGPNRNPLHSPDYAPNGAIVFEADWNGESVWRLPAGSSTPVKIGSFGNDNSPCVLSEGKVASLWLPGAVHDLKVMNADGSGHFKTTNGIDVFDIGIGCTSVQSGGDSQAPSVPANVSTDNISATQIDLSWDASTDNVDVTGYKIFRDNNEVGTSATTTFNDSGLTSSTTYSYTVSAYDAAGNNSAKSSAVNATTAILPGDVTNNGQVDLKDAITCLHVVAGLTDLPATKDADVNDDNLIGLAEAIFILNRVAN